jgi:hypothetical protein
MLRTSEIYQIFEIQNDFMQQCCMKLLPLWDEAIFQKLLVGIYLAKVSLADRAKL